MTPRMQIIRGLPGSGKTTLAINEFPDLFRIEADMYLTRGGEYVFTPELAAQATEWLYAQVEAAAEAGIDFVITGVFSGETERLTNVIEIAADRGYEVYIHTLDSDYGNTHGVPERTIKLMKAGFMSDDELLWLLPESSGYMFGLMDKTKGVNDDKDEEYENEDSDSKGTVGSSETAVGR